MKNETKSEECVHHSDKKSFKKKKKRKNVYIRIRCPYFQIKQTWT